jgi:NADPH-dependent curcumin reductase CurA
MTTPLPTTTRQWRYTRVPDGLVGPEHYTCVEVPLDVHLAEGEALIEAAFWSVDPYMRINQSRRPTWNAEPHPLDAVQAAAVVGRVLASRDPGLAAGDWVEGPLGWQTHARAHTSTLRRLDPAIASPSTALGVLGMPGRTAWFGLMEAGRPRPGDVVAVSAAGGAVGSLVLQFAKRAGATVVAIAGGADKCRWLRETLGADVALDHRAYSDAGALEAALREAVGGVDVYFDNTGGAISDAVMPTIRRRARIVICGAISQYGGGLDAPESGPRFTHHFLYQRATMQGILARDYLHRMDEMLATVGPWVQRGEIVFEQTITHGFDTLPAVLQALFTASHRGKRLVAA